MDLGASKEKVGHLVQSGKAKKEREEKLQCERYELMFATSPETLYLVVKSIIECLKTCAPFLEGDLMVAFKAKPKEIEDVLLETTRKVLSYPIDKEEWQWFRQFVMRSSVWFMRSVDDDRSLYEKMFEIAEGLTKDVNVSMEDIYKHMMRHDDWKKVMAIKEQTWVSRQDAEAVGLLRNEAITNLQEMKVTEDNEEGVQKLKDYVESNLAISTLSCVAKKINQPFQDAVKQVIGEFGEFRQGPLKKIDRCVSKLENDYQGTVCTACLSPLEMTRFLEIFGKHLE